MLSLPLPFVVVIFLAFLLLRQIFDDRDWTAPRRAFAALLALCMVHGTVTGLVWSYGLTVLRPALPILASLLPVVTWLAFRTMAHRRDRPGSVRLALHAVPTIAILPLAFTGSLLIDPIIILTFLAHGIVLWRMGRGGPDIFQKAQLHRSLSVARAAQGAGFLLMLNACVDISIIVDFQLFGGAHVPTILSAISVIILLLLATAAASGTAGASEDDGDGEDGQTAPLPAVTEDHQQTARRVDALMHEARLYTDPDLTLLKIARKVGIPAREISSAINRHHGMNVSQYVNRLRLDDACRLLEKTDHPITTIQFESGFQTKSNFNREFRRQFGCSPTQWRAGRRAAPA